ncbi:NB-ARC domain-containing protein [Streptomyces sp. C10]|uniref:NB-ARC domain-containing protein n=1 Tax=Streptomyces sp. C10 TaxID=531941 RepID=UPI00397EA30E
MVVAAGVLSSLAVNAATEDKRWPGALDVLRQHPWVATGALSALALLAAVASAWWQEHPLATAADPPAPPRIPIPGWVVGRGESDEAVSVVCARRTSTAVGITTSLEGAGGFGKTTLATVVCAHPRVRRRFRGRVFTITMGRDVRGQTAVAAKVAEATRFITGDTATFDDPDLAGAHLGRLLDQRPRTLLVLDDVWEAEQLAPFLYGGSQCVRLVTTRTPAVLPPDTTRISVDEMTPDQARAVLTWQLHPPLPEQLTQDLLRATGRWALLLRLTNRLITEQVATGVAPDVAATGALAALRTNGPAAVDDPAVFLDLNDPRRRRLAVRATVEAATALLPPGGTERFAELGVFLEDEAISVTVTARLWQATGGLTEAESRDLCAVLGRLSLLSLTADAGGQITLHDVIRDYLRAGLGPAALTTLSAVLVDAVAADLPTAVPIAHSAPEPGAAWWQVSDGYLLDHLIEHLLAAGRTAQAEAVASDLRWVEARLSQRGPTAPWSDLSRIPTSEAAERAREIAQAAHLLGPTIPSHALVNVLRSRLQHLPAWRHQITVLQHEDRRMPALVNRWPMPDLPDQHHRRTLTGHTNAVRAVAIAPDDTWIATASDDGTVRIWDVASGNCTATLSGHTDSVHAVAIAPDGTWIATASPDKTIRTWDVASGNCTAMLVHPCPMRAVGIAPDGTWVASAGDDGVVRLIDITSGQCTATLSGHTAAVHSVAISPDGTWIVSASPDEGVRIWNTSTGTCTGTLPDHILHVRAVAIAPDSTWFVTGGDSGVAIWGGAARRTCKAFLTGRNTTSIAIAPHGRWLAIADRYGVVQVWNIPEGQRFATDEDRPPGVWEIGTSSHAGTLTGHVGGVLSVAIATGGGWLATSGEDMSVHIRDSAVRGHMPGAPPRASTYTPCLAIAPDGRWLAAGSGNGAVQLWDIASAACAATVTGTRHSDWIVAVAVSPDGTWIASGGADGSVRIWDTSTQSCTTTMAGLTNHVLSVAIAPNGRWMAFAGSDGAVRIWSASTRTCTSALTGHTNSVHSVAIAPDSTWLATGSADGTVRIWGVASGTCTGILSEHSANIRAVAIAPDGSWLTSASDDGEIRIWDTSTRSCTATLADRASGVNAVAIAPDGTRLATAHADGTLQVWDITPGLCTTLMRVEGQLLDCAWTPDGSSLTAAGVRGLYFFDYRT